MYTYEIKHPLIQHKLTLLRKHNITSKDFRQLTKEITIMLCYEAMKDAALSECQIETWQGQLNASELAGKKANLVPILRAGLGMLDGALEVMPNAKVSMIGIYRDKITAKAHVYFNKPCTHIDKRLSLVIDPMLATAGSMIEAIHLLKKKGQKNQSVNFSLCT